jgi:uncharacterized protein YegP (UPF0339 family)
MEDSMNTVQIYKDAAGEWRWRLVASNGQTVATSGEGYKNLSHCEEMVNSMWTRFGEADILIAQDVRVRWLDSLDEEEDNG